MSFLRRVSSTSNSEISLPTLSSFATCSDTRVQTPGDHSVHAEINPAGKIQSDDLAVEVAPYHIFTNLHAHLFHTAKLARRKKRHNTRRAHCASTGAATTPSGIASTHLLPSDEYVLRSVRAHRL